MRDLLNGTRPADLGHDFEGSQDSYETLTDLVMQSPDTQSIEEPADPEYGLLLKINRKELSEHQLREDTAALFYVSNGHPDDAETWLHEITAEELALLKDQSISLAMDDIINERASGRPSNS